LRACRSRLLLAVPPSGGAEPRLRQEEEPQLDNEAPIISRSRVPQGAKTG